MIVRIQSAGQFCLADEQMARLQDLDAQLVTSISSRDEQTMHALLQQIISFVQEQGQPLAPDDLSPSELILPPSDATLDDVKAVLREDGLVPG